MRFNKNSGQITVFLCIILLAVIILAGVLVDASRVSSGESLVKSAVGSAARSVLAGYSSRLKENYGIFAYNAATEDELRDTVEHYLEKNLGIISPGEASKAKIDLYGFRIESINVSTVHNLSENRAFKQQILEYMKYRAPKEMIEGFVERLSTVKDMGRMSTAYSKKVGLDKMLGKLDKAQQSLKKYVDGSGKDTDKYINGFNLNGIWQETFNNYLGWKSDIVTSREELDMAEEELERLQQQRIDTGASNGESEEGGEENNDLINRINDLKNKRDVLGERISSLDNSINEAWVNLRYTLTADFTRPNEKAVLDINKIMEAGKKAQELINGLESFLSIGFAGESDFVKTLSEELNKIKSLILEGQQAADILMSLENNTQVLNQIIENLDMLKNQSNDDENVSLSEIIPELILKYDNHVEYSYEKPEKGGTANDPRKDKVKELKETLLENLFDDVNFSKGGIIPEELPSRKKAASRSFEEEDAAYIKQALPDDSETIIGKEAQYEGELGNIAQDADLYDEEGMFQENALGFAGSIGSLLEGDLIKLRDNIFINEYIMGMFKNHVPSVNKDENENTFTFLNGISRDKKETFFECEVEYILHGDSSEITNRALTSAQILLLRLGANTLHVYTDAKKRKLSVTTATAVAGWWTGGAGIPIISNLIMCAWGMGESVIDLKMLTSGEAIPIYKSPGDWKLDIGLPKSSGPKTDAKLYFSYHDYLRLFLLVMNEDAKLGRMEDLMEINTRLKKPDFKASGCNTRIRVEAEISMKNLFISQPFMPDSIRTSDGRRKIRVLVYEGY